MPKSRIGLSLSEDVAEILDDYGRNEFAHTFKAKIRATGVEQSTDCRYCHLSASNPLHKDKRPTRTQIIEEAVRDWGRAKKIGNAVDEYDYQRDVEANSLSSEAVQARTEKKAAPHIHIDKLTLERNDRYAAHDEELKNSLSPESKQKRNVVKAEKRERKAKLQKGVKAGLSGDGGNRARVSDPQSEQMPSGETAQFNSVPPESRTGCPHPAQSRTTGKNWKCTACGFQNPVSV